MKILEVSSGNNIKLNNKEKRNMNKRKVSIITVVWNNKETIKDAIDSVLKQTYKNIEYIIIDGASTDGTVEVVQSYGEKISKFVSEPDRGLYDAMNKGIALATGDVVGILNSDDFYIDEYVIEKVVREFEEKQVDSVYADLVYVKPENIEKVVRYYDSSHFTPEKFAYGWMPAHPTFFVRRWVYEKYGVFRTDLKIGADFDILARFLYTHKISYSYMKEVLVKMRIGGVSTGGLKATWQIAKEQLQVCRDNGIDTNIFKIFSKYPRKIMELLKK
jgi:glycosyltransferase involved in cell wall biosynthesis